MITGSSETKEAEKVHEIASVYYWKEKKFVDPEFSALQKYPSNM